MSIDLALPFLLYYIIRYSSALFLFVSYLTYFFKSLSYFCFILRVSSLWAIVTSWLLADYPFWTDFSCFL